MTLILSRAATLGDEKGLEATELSLELGTSINKAQKNDFQLNAYWNYSFGKHLFPLWMDINARNLSQKSRSNTLIDFLN